MAIRTREIYRSANGDRWLLAIDSDSGRVFVRHEPNLPSGGQVADIEIGAFLSGLPAPSRAAGNSCCAGHPLRDPNWLLGGGFCRSRCWLGYHYRIGNRLRNIDGFRAGLMNTNHAGSP